MATSNLTADDAREYLSYNPDNGQITWRFVHRNKPAGSIASHLHKSTGYLRVSLLGGKYQAHRVAWLLAYGEWPDVIDHINGDKIDNRLCNLRSVTHLINNQNMHAPRSTSTSRLLGAKRHKSSGMWAATIHKNGKSIHIGLFETAMEAHNAYVQAKRVLHEGCTI